MARVALQRSGLPAKLKIAVGFYQVIITLGPIYRASLPDFYKQLMSPFDLLTFRIIDVFDFPVECFAGHFRKRNVSTLGLQLV